MIYYGNVSNQRKAMNKIEDIKKTYFSKDQKEWESFFHDKKEQIQETIDVYLELKNILNTGSSDLLKQWFFLAFYGMGGKLKKEKKERFISHFSMNHEKSIDEVKRIVNEINDDKVSSSYYSFVTKLLNMQDEDFFPIYDSRIASVFFEEDEKDKDDDLNKVHNCYKRIKELYDLIAAVDEAPIKAFKKVFKNADGIGKMRILDYILYNSIQVTKCARG